MSTEETCYGTGCEVGSGGQGQTVLHQGRSIEAQAQESPKKCQYYSLWGKVTKLEAQRHLRSLCRVPPRAARAWRLTLVGDWSNKGAN